MKKRMFSGVLALLLCGLLTVSVFAAQNPRLVDGADLLSYDQETELLDYLDQLSRELQCDLVVITVQSCDGSSPDHVAEDFYDRYGYGYGADRDGVLLLLSMEERDWRILSNGFAADAITLGDIDEIGAQIVDELSAGEYMEAFEEFASLCHYEINGERNGFPFDFGTSLMVSLGIGVAAALITTLIMRSKLKSVRTQTGAREYTKPGSMQLTHANDLFLYRTMNRRAKPQQSSGSRSGGGGGRNVGGGKF